MLFGIRGTFIEAVYMYIYITLSNINFFLRNESGQWNDNQKKKFLMQWRQPYLTC